MILLLSGCAPKTPPDCNVTKNVYGVYVKQKGPYMCLHLDASVSPSHTEGIVAAVEAINEALGYRYIQFDYPCNNVISVEYSSWSGEPKQTAYATRWYDYKNINSSRIYFNEDMYNIGTGKGYVDMKTLATHEIMHIMGYNHVSDKDSVLYPTLGYDKIKQLTNSDIESLRCVYGKD